MATEKAGSLAPMTANKGKWHDGIDSADLSTLTALATDINKAVDNTVKQVARGKIKVGKLLLEARAQFKDDQSFGLWRKKETMVQSKQHAHYLMQVAERFGDAPKLIDGANYSVMQELVLADQSDIEWVEKKIEDGDPPTVQEVRGKVKQTQAERLAPKGTSKKGTSPGTGTLVTPNAHINTIVKEELHIRIKMVVDREIKGLEGHLLICGLDPDPQIPCNPDVLEAIDDFYEGRANEEHYNILCRSLEKVQEEFKNW